MFIFRASWSERTVNMISNSLTLWILAHEHWRRMCTELWGSKSPWTGLLGLSLPSEVSVSHIGPHLFPLTAVPLLLRPSPEWILFVIVFGSDISGYAFLHFCSVDSLCVFVLIKHSHCGVSHHYLRGSRAGCFWSSLLCFSIHPLRVMSIYMVSPLCLLCYKSMLLILTMGSSSLMNEVECWSFPFLLVFTQKPEVEMGNWDVWWA